MARQREGVRTWMSREIGEREDIAENSDRGRARVDRRTERHAWLSRGTGHREDIARQIGHI